MPKVKQPLTLQKLALALLLQRVMNNCDQLSAKGYLDELREAIFDIKETVCNRIPWHLLSDFVVRFLNYFYREDRPVEHLRAALEMMMDMEIVGLQCKGPIMAALDFVKDGHRILRIKELDLSGTCYPNNVISLTVENFNLDHLTTFIYPSYCADVHLNTVGRNCPKLQVLKVPFSKDVTNEGLRALRNCTELRVVDVTECFAVTHTGLNYLLEAHEKLEDFIYGYDVDFERPIGEEEPNVLAGLDWSKRCPSLKRFVFENDRTVNPPVRFKHIVQKFPNLVYFQINCMNSEDLSALKYLDKLTGLEVNFVNGESLTHNDVASTWRTIMKVLKRNGTNFTTLLLSVTYESYTWNQTDLDFIFNKCPNVENLKFAQGDGVLVIPPFKKLRHFTSNITLEFHQQAGFMTIAKPSLKFGELINLETLSLREFPLNLRTIESIMLDNKKFPQLSIIQTGCVPIPDLIELQRVARKKNLNFRIESHHKADWYTDIKLYYGSCDSDYDLYCRSEDVKCRTRLTILRPGGPKW